MNLYYFILFNNLFILKNKKKLFLKDIMATYDEKEKDKGDYNPDEVPTIRIILKSQETKNLEYVANTIVKMAKEKGFVVRGPKFMPNKHLSLTVRKSPCGEGTNTFDAFEMKIHTRIVDIKCSPNSVSEITKFKIKPGVDINIKIWNE
jgi:small subunit ribosomal protein S20e